MMIPSTFRSTSSRLASQTRINATQHRLASSYCLAAIAGDGIGHEVVPAAQKVLQHVNADKYKFRSLKAGFECFQQCGNALPEETVSALKECDGALFGAVSSPSHKVAGYKSPIVQMRQLLSLYANVRPIQSNDQNLAAPIDMLIIRENTECLYVKQEKETMEDGQRVARATRVITEHASRRVAKMALDRAWDRYQVRLSTNGAASTKPKVTVVHKANVLSVTDGLFRECALDEHKRHPHSAEIQLEEQLVDSMVYRMFREPQVFDVVVAPNLYGDIISDGAAALVGSLGVVPGANVGENFVMGEPVHGSAPDIQGKNIANPVACIRSAALLLHYLNESADAVRIEQAVDKVMQAAYAGKKEWMTPDLGGKGTTTGVTDAIISHL